ncbi:MAG: type-F conjugative transfer system secretin TraK [Proteobacteria bacterium]|nr:type-F conjugative transfer system secretin TraK [Pseudomonadota bacterium]
MQRNNKVVIAMLMLTSFTLSAKANVIANSNQIRHQEEDKEQILKLEYGKPLKVTVSSSEINRISFVPNVIVAIWGDNTKYSALLSKNGSELFLTTKVEENKKIHLSVELSGGKVVDLELTAIASESAKIVKIEQSDHLKAKRQLEGITRMLEAMKAGTIGKYNVKEIKSSKAQILKNLNIVTNKSYKYEDLIGFVLTVVSDKKKVRNKVTETQIDSTDIEQIKKELSNQFKNVIAIDMAPVSKSKIGEANYTVYLVTRTGEEV